jgi:hypothetical protein
MLARRGFIGGLLGALAAPAIIRPGLLMPVRVIEDYEVRMSGFYTAMPTGLISSSFLMEELSHITRKVMIPIIMREICETPLLPLRLTQRGFAD